MKHDDTKPTTIIIIVLSILLLLVLLYGCKTTQQKTEHTTTAKIETFDSISRIERENARLLVVPRSSASLDLNFKNLNDLPIGAEYTDKQGLATISVKKTDENDYKITATCDSLAQLVVDKETEIFHLNSKVRELEDVTNEERVEIINETTPIRWFWIYSGRLFWSLVGIGIIYWIWKKKLPF
ncbi:hypothetical protein FACS1894169_01120 [Bacteroidia bacterium]|nr:hypothetical protein FACS1894169_01120 [Bacteroidia bacterium]